MNRLLLIVGLAFSATLLVGCGQQQSIPISVVDRSDPTDPANAITAFDAGVRKTNGTYFPTLKNQSGIPQSIKGVIVNYGNGVYYFPYTRADFGNSLSWFLGQQTNLEVTSMVSDVAVESEISATSNVSTSTVHHDHTVGYFVTFREKN